MIIHVEVRSEDARSIARLDDVNQFLPAAVPQMSASDLPQDPARYPMLSGVAPESSTCFNRLQVLCATYLRQHRYLWFIPRLADVPISITLINEDGHVIARSNVGYLPPAWSENFRFEYPLLAGIDPYGDTLFNERQAARLRLEALALLNAADLSKAQRESLEDVIEIVEANSGQAFVKFVGD